MDRGPKRDTYNANEAKRLGEEKQPEKRMQLEEQILERALIVSYETALKDRDAAAGGLLTFGKITVPHVSGTNDSSTLKVNKLSRRKRTSSKFTTPILVNHTLVNPSNYMRSSPICAHIPIQSLPIIDASKAQPADPATGYQCINSTKTPFLARRISNQVNWAPS